LSGIWWGFDLPTVLLGYILSIVLIGMTADRRENILHLLEIVGMMILGQFYRNNMNITTTWHSGPFGISDILEIGVIFGAVASMLVFSHRAEKTLLDRAKRTEYLLRKEKESLEVKVEEKVSELKKAQIEHLSAMYRFVEFGKLSSGLFHDLMSPVQTLKIHMESFAKQKLDIEPYMQIQKMQTVSKKIETMLESMRKQIRFNLSTETFDVVEDIQDLLLITKHIYLKHNVAVTIDCDTPQYTLHTKRVIINHILLNLISNACEACDPTEDNNLVTIRIGSLADTQYKTYISIEDTGVGIPQDKISRVFDNFYSTKHIQTNTSMNCGIGLSSSKHALEQHLQGKLLLESEEGVGTTITLLLPVQKIS
jgi:signal transduction histidine kinase